MNKFMNELTLQIIGGFLGIFVTLFAYGLLPVFMEDTKPSELDKCIEIFEPTDTGCEVCEWMTTREYVIIREGREGSFTSVVLYCEGCFTNYALDYLTAEEYAYIKSHSVNQ